jgi:hypothetical protein
LKARNLPILISLFYPLVLAFMAAGFLGFVLLLIKIQVPIVASVVLWFYFICILSIYFISKEPLRALGFRKLFLMLLLANGLLALLSTAVALKFLLCA